MIEIVGDEAAAQSFAQLAKDLSRPEAFLAAVAAAVTEQARAIAPRRTGALASSVRARPARRGYFVGTAMPYAQFVHYGSIHNRPPIPFIDIAAKRVEPVAQRAAEQGVNGAIGRAGL